MLPTGSVAVGSTMTGTTTPLPLTYVDWSLILVMSPSPQLTWTVSSSAMPGSVKVSWKSIGWPWT